MVLKGDLEEDDNQVISYDDLFLLVSYSDWQS